MSKINATKIKILTNPVKAVPITPRWLNMEPNSIPPNPPRSIPLTKLPLDEEAAVFLDLFPKTDDVEFVFEL